MKRTFFARIIVFSLFVLLSGQMNAAILNFQNSISGAAIYVNTPAVNFEKEENNFTSLPTTPGFVNASVKNKVSVGVDHSTLNYVGTAYHYRYKLLVESWNTNVPSPTSTNTIYLSVQYDPAALTNYRDLSTYSFTGGHKVKVSILEIYNFNTSTLITNPPDNMFIKIDIEVERYYNLNTTAVCPSHTAFDLNGDSKDDQIIVSWSSINGAEEYELEWTYVDDYDAILGTPKAISSISWNFVGDNTRVTVKTTQYAINLTYDRGYIIYRVRGIGRKTSSPYLPVIGPWSLANTGTDPSVVPSSCVSASYYYVDEHEGEMNWQYTGTFAEEGKKKEVIGYYDGSLRNRQTVTVNNSDNIAIAGESYYDYQGRKAVDALPVPTGNNALGYNPNFNVNVSLDRYSKLDFDLDGSSSCSSTIGTMSTTSGSSQYYSSSNPNNTGNNAFIPDAEQFPFSQVEYTPDNTGRIRRMGGVGANHQLNTGHETKYYYGQPTQWELDRLFGTEVGYNNHYKKNMVIDPNGQISISYIDMHGRVIATALSGESPSSVSALNSDDPINVTVDLLAKDANGKSLNNSVNAYFNSLTYQTQLLVSSPGEHIINYALEMPQVNDSCLSASMCFDCIYDLKIEVRDDCGNLVYQSDLVKVGSPTLNSTCGSIITFSTSLEPIELNLAIGNYQISKVLTINEDAYNYYLSLYLTPEGNSCFVSYEDMLTQELSLLNYDDCNFSCQRCVQALGSKDEYVLNGKGTEADWLEAYNICMEPCRPVSPCEVMLMAMKSDMSPGGQYAEWYDSSIHAIQVRNFPLSVLNEDNQLPDGGIASSSGGAFWRNPKLPDGTTGYFEEDKVTRTKINLIKNIDGTFSPSVISNTYAYGNAEDGYYTYPEYLSNLEDFIAHWNSSWSMSLIVYHPEFCYNKWCIDNLEIRLNPGDLASYEFDDAISQTETYADAVNKGYISATPTIHDLIDIDPYFQSVSTSQLSDILAKCSVYLHHGTNDYNILQVASMTAKCGSFYGDNFSSSCTAFGTGTTEQLDEMWNVLKALYIGAKQVLIKEAADNFTLTGSCKGYNKCIGLEQYNPFSSRARGFVSTFWIDNYQPCSHSTYRLYVTKQKRFLIGDIDIKASEEDIQFTYFNNTGKCPGENSLFELLNEIASKGQLTTTNDLYTYKTYTPWLYEQVTGSSPGGTYIEYETVPTISGISGEKFSLDLRLKGTSTLFSCGFKFEFIDNPFGYSWSDIVGFNSASKVGTDAVAGTNLYDIVVMVNDGISPDPVPFTIRGNICSLFSNCEFYDDCKPSDFAISLQLLLSGLANGSDLTSASSINLETGYPNYLSRQIRNVIGGIEYNNLRWIYNGSGSFTISDPITTPTGYTINLQATNYSPAGFTHSDLNKIKYFENLRIDPADVKNGFIIDAWYEPSVGAPLQMVSITFSSDRGILARCFDPVPLNCKTPEYYAQRDLDMLLSDVLTPKPTTETDLSSNILYTELLESFLGHGYAFMLTPTYSNDEIKGYIQIRDGVGPSANVINQCSFGLYRLNEAFSFNDFNDIVSMSNLQANELKMVDGKSFYFTIDVVFSNGIVETVGGYTSCIPLMNCGCYKEVVTSCRSDYAAIIDYTSKYNNNYNGMNPNTHILEEMPGFSKFDCQCGKSYMNYLIGYSDEVNPPLSFVNYVKQICIPNGDFCNDYQLYYSAVERYNDYNSGSTIEIETNIEDGNCECIESYVDYLGTFNSSNPLFTAPPMSFSDYLANGCQFPGLTDNCASLLPTYIAAINAKIADYNTTLIPPGVNLPGAPLPNATLTNTDCNCVVKYISYLDRYIMNGLSEPGIMSGFPAALSFAAFKANGCQGTCISEYFIYAETMQNNGVTPVSFDPLRCDCYLNYTNYFNDNNINGVFMGMGLDDFCDNPPAMMAMSYGGSGNGNSSVLKINEESEISEKENSKLNIKTEKDTFMLDMDELQMQRSLSLESYIYEPKPRASCMPPDTVNYPQIELINSCFDYLDGIAELIARSRYQAQIEYFTARFREKYLNTCMSPTEDFTLQFPNYDYHYTLYYYDQGGNLLRTVPPAGVSLITNSTDLSQVNTDRTNNQRQVFTSHSLVTTYEYNSLNQLMRQNIPDNDLMNRWTVYSSSSGIPATTSIVDVKFIDANNGYLIGNSGLGTELYRTTDGGRTFNPVSIQTSDLNKVKMLDANNGFAVGLNGLLFQTTDGGDYWKVIQIYNSTTPVNGTINDFYFKTATDGILVGDNGLCYHAYYNGSIWTFTPTTGLGSINLLSVDFESTSSTTLGFIAAENSGVSEVYSITGWPSTSSSFSISTININTKLRGVDINRSYFIDNNNGFAAGKDGQLLKTTDAGNNWIHIGSNCVIEFKDLYFVDANNGMALAGDGKFYSTSNGGADWDAISTLGNYNSMHMYDKTSATKLGFAAGDDGLFAIVMYQSSKGFRVFKQTMFASVTDDFSSVFGLNSSELFVGGNSGYLAKITKSGNDWALATISTSIATDIVKVYFNSNTLGACLASDGDIYKLTYSGSWTSSNISTSLGVIKDFDYNSTDLVAIVAPTGATAISYAKTSLTSLTILTPTSITISNAGEVSSISIVNSSSNFVLNGNLGAIYTGNTGAGVLSDNSKKTQPLKINSIRAVAGSNTIFASGEDGTLIQSSDGGANWQTIETGTSSDLNDMDAYGTSEVYVVGNSGTIVKFTTVTSLLNSGTTENLYAVKRYGANSVAFGGANKTLLYSSNGGTNIASIFMPRSFDQSASINALTAAGTTLYLTGGKGVIYQFSAGTFSLTYNVPENNNSIRFDLRSKMGLIACNKATVILSEDLGQSWTLKPMIGTSTVLNIHTSWIFGKSNILLAGNTNWCRKWNYTANTFSTPSGLSSGSIFKDMAFNDKGQGFIVDNASGVNYSYNSGATFSSSTISGATLNSVDIEGPEAYIACNSNEVYWYSGLSNTTPPAPTLHTSPTTSTNFNKIVLLDRTIGYLIGNSGQVVKMINPDLSSPSFYQEYSEVGNTNTSNHLFAVDYNSRGSIVIGGASGYTRTIEDDARTVSNIFWYDELGRLVVSQNSKQFNYATPAYSYTQFDALGRITEVGEFESTSGPQDYMLVNNVDYIGISTLINGSTKRQVTQTWYDNDFAPMGAGITQVNLRKRVASITYEETFDGNNSTYDHASHYTYDIHGNVDLMVQEVPALAAYGSQFKKIRYEYDLVSGKVNSVHFNENELDQFHHRYTYDADNRITMVETSRDNINWDVDATYQYYLHGPLMRTEIGDLKVQGIDFAYTLHGWIKGVNAGILDPVRDMGKDGHVSVGNLNQYVARDAFGYILGYYSNPGSSVEDYISINSSGVNHFLPNTSGSDLMTFRNNLFNGNITSMQTALPNCSTYNASKTISNETFGNAYNYDQLNRIKSSRTFTNLNSITNAWGSTGMVSQNYSTDYTYDANGNILNLTRWGNGTQMDEFSYNYNVQSGKLQSNRLYHVNDNVALSSNYADDIDDQGTFNSTLSTINTANNYGYDELGNLIRDNAEDISSIEWNVQGKITKVNRNSGSTKPTLEFTYDAMGQRLSKKVTESSGNVKTFYYIRDAQGNEMSRYVHYTDGLGDEYFVSEEHSIYGSSRLGLQTRRDTLYKNTTITPNYDYVFRDLGTKQYELSNHLGNVLATITDQNKPVSGGGITIDSYEPVVVSISDYSPFGSLIPNRSWSDASRVYRYGFNGKEKDFETAADNYDFGARIYDGRLGRWLSLDPHFNRYPSISPYVSLINKPICFIDPNGKDIIILIWATKLSNVGHTAFAVAEYEEIIEIITEEIWVPNDNPTPEDIKSGNLGEWVTIQKTVRTGKFRPTGLYTLYELGPDANLNKGTSDDDVNPQYTKRENLTFDQIMGEGVSVWKKKQADGVILIKTDKKTDETIHYELGVIYPIISPTSMYNGFTNNCTDYGKKAAELATGESIDAEEELRGQPVTTPNKLYNALKNTNNTTVLRNADKKTKHNFVRSFFNIFRIK